MQKMSQSVLIEIVQALGPVGALGVFWLAMKPKTETAERQLLLLESIRQNTEATKEGVLRLLERGRQ